MTPEEKAVIEAAQQFTDWWFDDNAPDRESLGLCRSLATKVMALRAASRRQQEPTKPLDRGGGLGG